MEWIKDRKQFLKKYYPAAIVVGLGVLLLALPTQDTPKEIPSPPAARFELEQELEEILCTVAGAGKARVLLTPASGEETMYQTDQDSNGLDTVLVSGEDRRQTGLVRRIDPPDYRGAVVVCQGADSANVRLAVVQAVMAVTGLSSERITVLKMK